MPSNRKFDFHSEMSGTALSVLIVPKARKSEIKEIRPDGTLIIRLASDSFDEGCHPALLKYLAGILSIDVARLDVVAGEKGNQKIISILGIDSKVVDDRVKAILKIPN